MGRERIHLGRVVTEFEAGRPTLLCLLACDGCGYETKVKVARKDIDPIPVLNTLRHRGWSTGQKLRCPNCVAGRNNTPAKPQETPVKAAAEPPATPTPDIKRKIRDALYERYDEEKGHYRQAWSDKSLGAALNVPWAWVTALREALGFGPDKNESSEIRDKAIRDLSADLAQLSDDFMGKVADIENRLKKLSVEQAYTTA